MREILLDKDYAKIEYDADLKIGKIEWKRKTSTEEYQFAYMTVLEHAKKYPSDNFLSDITNQSVVSPENRKWFETEMIPKAIEAGLKRVGVVFDGNVFKKYYLNMILKVINKFGIPMKLFSSEEEAIEWFKGKDVAEAV